MPAQKLDRDRLKADLGNRKSLASQMRMKSIANLASDAPTKKRRRGNDDDNFGANDDDWGVYRQIATGDGSDDEEEEDLDAGLKTLEADLLEYDPDFTEENTLDAQTDWTKSLLHAFLRGPRPFDPKSQGEAHQLHLNVERIRVPEVLFQPAIAGLDQAGLIEIAADILTTRLNNTPNQSDFLKDIFLTGGHSQFQNFDERLREGLRGYLPAGAPIAVRRAKDPVLDAWKGAARWVGSEKWKGSQITRGEYQEKGAEWFKVCLVTSLSFFLFPISSVHLYLDLFFRFVLFCFVLFCFVLFTSHDALPSGRFDVTLCYIIKSLLRRQFFFLLRKLILSYRNTI
jgi:actin-related protein 5